MGRRSTLVLLGSVVTVATYLRFADTPSAPPDRASGQAPGMATALAMHRLVAFDPGDVVGVQLQRMDQTRSVHRQNGTWEGIDDPAAINDFLHTLAELPVLMDISPSDRDLAEFGLAPPVGVIVLHTDTDHPLVLQIGNRNPATTGVYVRTGENGTVVLAGALIEWEFDKLFMRLGATTG